MMEEELLDLGGISRRRMELAEIEHPAMKITAHASSL
jgi:hypothetical protein